MEYKYKQLEQELSALGKVFGELGSLLSSTAKEVTAPGVVPPEKLIQQIASARAGFDQVRTAVHAHAATMLVNPLPKASDLQSLAALESLLKTSGAAEEAKYSLEGERGKALGILDRALSITHREIPDFKPLQECHAKIAELRAAIDKVLWPQRHPEAEAVNAMKHAATALLSFVENLESLDDERWIALEAVITETYGKPLFVAASRGKLIAAAPEAKPAAAAKAVPPAAVVTEKAAPPADKPKSAPVAAKPAPAPVPVEKKAPVVVAPPPVQAPVEAPVAAPPAPAASVQSPAPAAVPAQPAAAPAVPQPATQTSAPAAPRPPLNHPQPASAIHSLTALATATEPPIVERKPAAPPTDIAERQRKEPRLATQVPPQAAAVKPEPPKPTESEINGEPSRAVAGDGIQRPQRWGFWRGNR